MPAVRQPKLPPVGNSPTCPTCDEPMQVVGATPAMLDALNQAERCRALAEEAYRTAVRVAPDDRQASRKLSEWDETHRRGAVRPPRAA